MAFYSLLKHTHVEADITDLGSYSVVGHTHTESDITDLQAYLLNIVEDTTPQLGGNLDAQSNSINTLASLTMDGTLTIQDATNTDALALSHDGTDLNAVLSTTTDMNFSGISGTYTFDQLVTITGANSLWLSSAGPKISFYENDQAVDNKLWDIRASAGDLDIRTRNDADSAGNEIVTITRNGTAPVRFLLKNGLSLYLDEIAADNGSVAGRGQIWVKNTTPCQLWFTDDAGTATQIV